MEAQMEGIQNIKVLKNNGPSGMPTTKRLVLVATCLLVNNLRIQRLTLENFKL